MPLLTGLLACGEEGKLSLRLLQAGFDKPFNGVDQLELRALDGALGEADRLTATVSDGAVELGVLPSGTRRLELRGLVSGATYSRGQSRSLALESGGNLEELLPFSTLQVGVALPVSRAISPAVTVDGNLGEWRASPSLVLTDEHLVTGPMPGSAGDLRAELSVAWATSGQLAFALLVVDDCPSLRVGFPAGTCGAAVAAERVYLGLGDLWLQIEATSLTVQRGAAKQSELAFVMAPRPDLKSWALEGTVALSALGLSGLSAADKLKVDLVVLDADPSDAQSSALRWTGGSTAPTQPTASDKMGTLGFGEPK